MNAEDVPTEGGDPAASPVPTTTGPAPPKRFRRAARPTAVTALEDLMPRELFIVRVVGDGYLLPTMLASVATVNRSFKDALYQPKVIMFRAATALTEVSALAEAKKWYEIAAERFTCREALVMLGQIAHDNYGPSDDTNELEKAERLLRSAIAAESPMATYFLLEPPEYALDVARVALASVLQKRGTGTGERAALLRDVLSHEPVLAKRALGADHPHWTASVLRAEMIIAEETPGTPAEALALLAAIPGDGRTPAINGSIEYLRGMHHKNLAAGPDDEHAEHARRAYDHMLRAMHLQSLHQHEAIWNIAVMSEHGFGTERELGRAYSSYLMLCKLNHSRGVERVRELIESDPPNPRFIQSVWTMREISQLTEDDMSRNQTLVQAWALASANPLPAAVAQAIAAAVEQVGPI